ncbi:RnfABCDGE type electron transport complex subunit D [Methylophilaceae bacterium]|jgi:electron transport complex protein RnfD|nr:RnfABCDGE type electron transport complex subunit D [Methylophilaceae bacterium]|tara:strand:+ start:3148 stop:4158 length:1011 start_codon:yes stop_codon:yes gene_type:complete
MFSQQSPFIQKAPSVTWVMMLVMAALVPGIIAYIFLFGFGVLLNITIAIITAVIAEYFILKIRNLPVKLFITDGSAVVAASLLALSIPSIAPWWIIVIGTLFTIIVAKHMYGGLGSNLFNPAMVGYAVLLISFPAIMTKWPLPISHLLDFNIGQQMETFFYGTKSLIDSVSSATPLDYIKTQIFLNKPFELNFTKGMPLNSYFNASIIISFCFLIGGIFMWIKKIITWHLPVTFLLSLILISAVFWIIDPSRYLSPLTHLVSGGTLLCAFFIITDPVSGPTTPKGKIFFAFGVALLVYLIRVFGGYPEGIAFAVILMNICVPLIDSLTQPRVFGHE